ncbi:hypothetical protein E2C01_042210 [Portunus trituberculatus]|uniref:Uncharacterized protein n=1 Tax=Portunus trituberculatus TaxID=210409 RepID=A0A5B7FST2_PORTR|nr:hypothetical protein [Portunus trituberculatus]
MNMKTNPGAERVKNCRWMWCRQYSTQRLPRVGLVASCSFLCVLKLRKSK